MVSGEMRLVATSMRRSLRFDQFNYGANCFSHLMGCEFRAHANKWTRAMCKMVSNDMCAPHDDKLMKSGSHKLQSRLQLFYQLRGNHRPPPQASFEFWICGDNKLLKWHFKNRPSIGFGVSLHNCSCVSPFTLCCRFGNNQSFPPLIFCFRRKKN